MSTPDIEITIPNFRGIPLVITVQSLDFFWAYRKFSE